MFEALKINKSLSDSRLILLAFSVPSSVKKNDLVIIPQIYTLIFYYAFYEFIFNVAACFKLFPKRMILTYFFENIFHCNCRKFEHAYFFNQIKKQFFWALKIMEEDLYYIFNSISILLQMLIFSYQCRKKINLAHILLSKCFGAYKK